MGAINVPPKGASNFIVSDTYPKKYIYTYISIVKVTFFPKKKFS